MDQSAPAAPGDPADAAARGRALDVTRSFIVQAPAGSGKTELLVQRFLALLARVDRPERIVAITFTRKAAGEMRERIVAALRDAEADLPCASSHAMLTRELARAALAQDARHGWALLLHPARLAVWTIDALCAGLAQQAPLSTRLGAAPRYEEYADALYVEAAREALAVADPNDPHWRCVLDYLDNDAGVTVRLLADLLGQRDQWLRELDYDNAERFRAALESTLAAEITGELGEIVAAFPASLAQALVPHQRYAAVNLLADPQTAELGARLAACAEAGGLPATTVGARDDWGALASWLLVANKPRFRMALTTNGGFPAKGSGPGAAERARHSDNMAKLLCELAAVPGLANMLDVARRLPPPRYDDDAWTFIAALLSVLPRLAAQLTLTFRNRGVVDFTHGAMAALEALGTEDAPSDLLLKLDIRIEHLLVDEFQDTSFTQLALIRQLTAGWQEGDGRTLFAVGDPMQSIYRFREAEVRVFVEAQEEGRVADVPVERLALSRNFRAQAGLVAWVNAVFPHVMGPRSDPWRGAVAFAQATPVDPALVGPAATLDLGHDAQEEALAVVERIRAAYAEGSRSIAVLVRARAHLDCVLPALRDGGIAFTAIDLDALGERQAVQDLVSLTHALQQPADRLAWLSVLRAPCCGLTLPDLFAVVAAADASPSRSLASLLDRPDAVPAMSAEGRARFSRLARCFQPADSARGRATLATRVRGAWFALGGPATLQEAVDVSAAERYFALIAEHETAGEIIDWASFMAALAELRAAPDAVPAGSAQVMTLHRAKGLEFDTVIIPGLSRPPTRSDVSLLRWRRRQRGLLLAPVGAKGGASDPVYEYLKVLEAEEENAELARLLYVGCTRAKCRLHLVATLPVMAQDSMPPAWKPPPSGSSLARLWEAIGDSIPSPETGADVAPPAPARAPLLKRLPSTWQVPIPDRGVRVIATTAISPTEALPFVWARETAKHVGVVAHRMFADIAREGVAAWNAERITTAGARIRAALVGEGVDERDFEVAVAQVQAAVRNALDDSRGRWLFAVDHADAASEWALAGWDGDAIVHLTLDRTFVADGVRWIVDFKTSTHEGADVEAFLDREVERYRGQLERYAKLVAVLDARPIRLGLYYPLLRGWREWAYHG
jgi:ATP-dependent helicase/nuclease subunit A